MSQIIPNNAEIAREILSPVIGKVRPDVYRHLVRVIENVLRHQDQLETSLSWLVNRSGLSVESVRHIADTIMGGVNLHPSSEATYDQLKVRIRRELHGIGIAGCRVFENGPCWCDIPNPESGKHESECATARAFHRDLRNQRPNK